MAARFWVGGTGTWDNSSTANWSATSGGASGASAPTNADTVTFDANSGTAATVTVAATARCTTCAIDKTDLILSLAGSPVFSGALTLTSGTINVNSSTLFCASIASNNSNTRAINFGTGKISLSASGTVWNTATLTGLTISGSRVVDITYASSLTLTVITGLLPESQSLSFNVLAATGPFTTASANTSINNLDFTGFTGTFSAATRNIYGNLTLSAGMTVAASAVNVTSFLSTSGVKTITSNGQTINFPVTFNGVGGTWECTDALTLNSTSALTLTNGTLALKNGATSTVGSFVTSGANRKMLRSTTAGAQATLSDASGTNRFINTSIKDINAVGGAVWNAYVGDNNIDAGNNTGWDFGAGPLPVGWGTYNLRSFTERDHF